ncbi:hypothetical protein BBJ28_00010092 [Nothophytophthora sp. Chile5]|nr:hypothetical protein BBJ28_00010092 [Nothophytophthora sp. Chile5]
MGNVFSFSLDSVYGMLATYFGDRESRIMIVGLDAAGKTTLLYQLKLGQHEITTTPTLGFNVETFQYKTVKFTAWDISGQKHIQSLWRHYLSNNDAVIFVVDAADRTRIDEAQQALHFIFEQEELSITKLLVYANKQDKSDTMSADEIREKLDLTEATRSLSHVQPCVATTGAGIHDGLDWLTRTFIEKPSTPRIEDADHKRSAAIVATSCARRSISSEMSAASWLALAPAASSAPLVSERAVETHGIEAQQTQRKSKKPRRKRRGWGPFQSVIKERSVAFNLTLDVQSLQQEVQHMTSLRDVLRTKTMLQRHSPEGSLFRVVKEYFHVFRTGWTLQGVGRKRLLNDEDQRAFLHSVMDAEVDVENGLRGPDVMAEQIIMYATFIRFIRLTMHSYDIVVAEDSVIISAKSTMRFQVLRNTIEMIFPHVLGHEWLVAQLVGQEIEAAAGITFSFNAAGKCCKYAVEMDFVAAFADVVKDPQLLDMLFGRALIADNCMFGILDDAKEETQPEASTSACVSALEEERDQLERELDELRSRPTAIEDSPVSSGESSSEARHCRSDAFVQRVVGDYYLAFATGYRAYNVQDLDGASRASQQDFLSHMFVSETSGKYVEKRWKALSEGFRVLSFQQMGVTPVEYQSQEELCVVRSTARYLLQITSHTIRSVFPHLLTSESPLVDVLVGRRLAVSSLLTFSIESDVGRISRIEERMDFVSALAELLPNPQDLSVVTSRARLTPDGCGDVGSPPLPQLRSIGTRPGEKRDSATRRMTMADILG